MADLPWMGSHFSRTTYREFIIYPHNLMTVLQRIRRQARTDDIRITQHVRQQMLEEEITLESGCFYL